MTTTLENVRQSIAEAFPFEVCKLPLLGPDRERTPHYGLFRDDNGACVGNACRRGYEPHTLDDVQALAEAASIGFEAGHCGITCSWDGGHNVIIGPTDEYRRAIYGTADNIFPRFILQAGYDGRAFTASLGLFRDACQNLQRIRTTGDSHSVSLRHTRQLRDRMPRLIETFRGLAARWDGVVSEVKRMQAMVTKTTATTNSTRMANPHPELSVEQPPVFCFVIQPLLSTQFHYVDLRCDCAGVNHDLGNLNNSCRIGPSTKTPRGIPGGPPEARSI